MEACLGTETLVDLVEGRADPAQRSRIEEHASRCEACRQVMSSLARSHPPDDAHPPTAEPRPVQVGRYVIARVLGAGGMGIVYAAHDPELDRMVAVKLLRGDAAAPVQDRLRREAQAMARLAHPHVVVVHDVGIHDDRIFIAMELVVGQNLAQWETATRTPRAILDAYLAAGRGLAAAHAVGIVHRDFKPDNVLVGDDGRVRVVDFGLARSEASAPATDRDLTVSGARGGTPLYMAPERYRGVDADPRSDQFSFCVSLFAALTGARPFRGEHVDELLANIAAGRVVAPRRPIARHVRAALRRGLSGTPEDRFATMDELLAALSPAPRRWPWIVGGVSAAALAVSVAVVVSTRAAAPAPCGGAADALRGTWDPERRLMVATSLLATGVPYAATTAREVERLLDRYARDWQAMHASACQATRVRGEQTEDLLALRMTCLDERRRALAGAALTLATRDPGIAEHAVGVAAGLPSIDGCADIAALRTPVRPPNPDAERKVEQLRGVLATLRTERDAGRYAPTLVAARSALGQARALGYRPLEAAALGLVAQLELDSEHYQEARVTYEQAALAGEAGRDDPATAGSLIGLIGVVGHGLGKPGDLAPIEARARAVLERLDHPPQLEASLLETLGMVEVDGGRFVEAERDLRAAIETREQLYGRDDIRVVQPLQLLAALELGDERAAEARALLERVLVIERRTLGDQHPAIARVLDMLGGAAFGLGAYDQAIDSYQRAQAIYERTVGPDSLATANVLSNLASAYQSTGDVAAALDRHRRAVAIAEAKLGPDHPVTLSYRTALASAVEDAGHHADALALLEPVLAAQRASRGAHPDTATTLELVASVELAMGRDADALAHAREAREMFTQALGDAYHPYDELALIGGALRGLGDLAGAADAFEAARQAAGSLLDPGETAWLDGQLGRALVEAHRDPARGRELVRSAWLRLATDPRKPARRAALASWMKQHQLAEP